MPTPPSKPDSVEVEADTGIVRIEPLGVLALRRLAAVLAYTSQLDRRQYPMRLWDFSEVSGLPPLDDLSRVVATSAAGVDVSRMKAALVGETGVAISLARIAASFYAGMEIQTFGNAEAGRAWLLGEEDAYFARRGYRVEISSLREPDTMRIDLHGSLDADALHDVFARVNAPIYDGYVRRLYDARGIQLGDTGERYEAVAIESLSYTTSVRKTAGIVDNEENYGIARMIRTMSVDVPSLVDYDEAVVVEWILAD